MFKWSLILIALAVSCIFASPASARLHPDGGFSAKASWYGGHERLNARTANGERFRPMGLTCAHRTLPLGTKLLVSHEGRSVVVRVTDRGPNIKTGRSLDLSRGAAVRLGLIGAGVASVRVALVK
jgi:rare lipoprotein A